jgi:hypothetical protein
MFKQIIEKLPFATILLSYFFVCGGLYLIGFWATFNIDITNFVSITDIPKSFVLPFVLTQGFFLLQAMINLISTPHIKEDDEYEKEETVIKKTKLKELISIIFNVDLLISIAFITIISFYVKYQLNSFYWAISGAAIGMYLVYKFTSIKIVAEKIPYPMLRIYLAYVVCLLPIFCFVTGKVTSINIYNNKDIMYINQISDSSQSGNTTMNFPKRDSSSLKLIGFLGDKLIISSINNKKIIFINQSSFKTVELTKQ